MHSLVTTDKAEKNMRENPSNYLFKYRDNILASDANSPLNAYHPETWIWSGHPHDTFAAYFIQKNTWLSFYLQIMIFSVIFVLVTMAIILVYFHFFEEGGY